MEAGAPHELVRTTQLAAPEGRRALVWNNAVVIAACGFLCGIRIAGLIAHTPS